MRRRMFLAATVIAIGAPAPAQQPAALRADTFATSGPSAPAPPGWTVHAADVASTASPATVRAYGPGVRLTTTQPTTLYRPAAPLTGDGTVGALVFVDATTPAIYGITLGGENGLAFLVQPTGAAAIVPLHDGQAVAAAWRAAPAVSMPAAGMRRPCRLEVRVQGTHAELRVNGTLAASTSIASGALNGVPGIYSGPGALTVVGLMVRTDGPAAPGPAKAGGR